MVLAMMEARQGPHWNDDGEQIEQEISRFWDLNTTDLVDSSTLVQKTVERNEGE